MEMYKYRTEIIQAGDIDATSNELSVNGWRLHSLLDWGEGKVILVFELGKDIGEIARAATV